MKQRLFIFAACLAGCSATPETVAQSHEPFATALAGEPDHEEITRAGLDFLQSAVITAIQAANVSVDVEFVLVNANHFDDCNFSEGAAVIRDFQTQAVAALDPSNVTIESDAAAIAAFGRWLHTAQDFYAHSNWVEDGAQGIVESTFDVWPAWSAYDTLPSGQVLVEGDPPKRTSVTRHADAPYPEDAVVRVKLAKSSSVGVMTGTVDYEPGNSCPPQVAMTHDDLNKDKSTTVGREAQFVTAKTFAVEQTRHEWCRLVAMTRAAWGDAGVARLMTWAVDPNAASCAQ
jgi:hypothetical protein